MLWYMYMTPNWSQRICLRSSPHLMLFFRLFSSSSYSNFDGEWVKMNIEYFQIVHLNLLKALLTVKNVWHSSLWLLVGTMSGKQKITRCGVGHSAEIFLKTLLYSEEDISMSSWTRTSYTIILFPLCSRMSFRYACCFPLAPMYSISKINCRTSGVSLFLKTMIEMVLLGFCMGCFDTTIKIIIHLSYYITENHMSYYITYWQ